MQDNLKVDSKFAYLIHFCIFYLVFKSALQDLQSEDLSASAYIYYMLIVLIINDYNLLLYCKVETKSGTWVLQNRVRQ